MTARVPGRHRSAARPITPLTYAAPTIRRSAVVAATSGLALAMITSGANAAGEETQNLAASAGELKVGPAAQAEALAASNPGLEVAAEVTIDEEAIPEVDVETVEEKEAAAAAQAAAEAAAAQAAAEAAAAQAAAARQQQVAVGLHVEGEVAVVESDHDVAVVIMLEDEVLACEPGLDPLQGHSWLRAHIRTFR